MSSRIVAIGKLIVRGPFEMLRSNVKQCETVVFEVEESFTENYVTRVDLGSILTHFINNEKLKTKK